MTDILSNSKELEEAWASSLSTIQIANRENKRLIIMKLYESRFWYIQRDLISGGNDIDYKSKFMNGLINKSDVEVLNITSVIEELVCDIMLPNTNGRLFVEAFKRATNEGLTPDESSKIAIMELVIKYLFAQVELMK